MTPNLLITGTLQEPDPDHPGQTVRVVYQRVAPGLGNIADHPAGALQRRAHVIPYDPKTPAQVARRQRFAAAVAAWRALDPENRSDWTAAARSRNITPFNAFVSAYMKD